MIYVREKKRRHTSAIRNWEFNWQMSLLKNWMNWWINIWKYIHKSWKKVLPWDLKQGQGWCARFSVKKQNDCKADMAILQIKYDFREDCHRFDKWVWHIIFDNMIRVIYGCWTLSEIVRLSDVISFRRYSIVCICSFITFLQEVHHYWLLPEQAECAGINLRCIVIFSA